MRRIVRLTGIAGAVALAACSGDSRIENDLQTDLDRASTATEIALPSSSNSTQVVSAIEQATPPAPRQIASSQRVVKHTPAPKARPAPVEVERAAVVEEVAPAPVEPAPAPAEVAPLPSSRPRPVATNDGGNSGGIRVDRGRGGGMGGAIGGIGGVVIGVVLRGGVVDGDECDPRSDGRRRGGVSINNRLPVGIGTFPGSGRIGGGMISTGGRLGRF
ncbi:MAG: hypothetical protein ABIS03_02825 [Gemmatimonadaceae bacterium]